MKLNLMLLLGIMNGNLIGGKRIIGIIIIVLIMVMKRWLVQLVRQIMTNLMYLGTIIMKKLQVNIKMINRWGKRW